MTASNRIALGTRKGLLILEQRADGWSIVQEEFLGIPTSFAMRDTRSGNLFACLDHGHWGNKFHRSSDDGKTWTELATPKYPAGAQIRDGVDAVLRYQWCMAAGGEDQPGRIYMGTEPGGLFVSDNDGDEWQIVESLWNHPSRKENWFGGGRDEAGIHSIIVDPRDSNRILIGISVAGVFESTDGGGSWQPKNKGLRADFLPNPDAEVGHDPHLLVQCRQQADVLWQQNHCGIFRSADGGENWHELTHTDGPAGFGFTVAVDPNNADIAWVIPATSDQVRIAVDKKLCVCRTDDGGKTWQTFRNGLPQQDCYDFAFRHALDLSGDLLAFGTVGGSLYISTDRGESWQSIAGHLPVVYSLKFI